MNILHVQALLAGVFFGIWPLLLNKSGLSGIFSGVVYTGVVLVCLIPLAVNNIGSLSNVSWTMAIGAGVVGTSGFVPFTSMLAKATVEEVSSLFVLMIIIQIATPALYHVVITGELTSSKGLGFLFAITSGILLTR